MKNILLFLITFFVTTNCNSQTNKNENSKKMNISKDTKTIDEIKYELPKILGTVTDTNKVETTLLPPPPPPSADHNNESAQTDNLNKIYFDNFCVPVLHPGESSVTRPLDWSSNPDAKMFKTRIAEAYKIGGINFAGHFITTIFGCGASCIMGFMIDVETGKIYDLPLGENNSCLYADDRALYKESSALFISGICRENSDSDDIYYISYLWDESSKDKNDWKFIPVKSDEFLVKKECKYITPQRYIRKNDEE